MAPRPRNNGSAARPHWRTPAVMLSSLMVGIALAAGHHAFYASLDSTAVSSESWNIAGWEASQQQINIATGTLFAFVVKASLILAASIAYMQLFFRALNTKDFKLSTLDHWYGALDDLPSLFCIASYWRYPLLTLVALTAWLLPIAAIISPASLSVTFDRIYPTPIRPEFVPQPAFESLAFNTLSIQDNYPRDAIIPEDVWRKAVQSFTPTDEVFRVTTAAASGGAILPISPPSSNASWQLVLEAPRLACNNLSDGDRDQAKANLVTVLTNFTSYMGGYDRAIPSYLAWNVEANDTKPTPFHRYKDTDAWALRDALYGPYFKLNDVDMLFGIFPRGAGQNYDSVTHEGSRVTTSESLENRTALMDWVWEDATVIRCQVIPSKYRLNFTYGGLDQRQRVQVLSVEDARFEYVPMFLDFEAYGSDLPINVTAQDNIEDKITQTAWISAGARKVMRQMTYSAVQLAFWSLVKGLEDSGGRGVSTQGPGYTTSVYSTVLANSIELQSLPSTTFANMLGERVSSAAAALTNRTSGKAHDEAAALVPVGPELPLRPFKDMIEELYFNVTISMASSRRLTYNDTSLVAPASVNVTFNIHGNVYSYAQDKLWLAYGLAIGVSFLNVLAGLWAVWSTGASFTANFSTLVRAARNADVSLAVHEESLPGKDPLPEEMKGAEMHVFRADSPEIKHLDSVEYTGMTSSRQSSPSHVR